VPLFNLNFDQAIIKNLVFNIQIGIIISKTAIVHNINNLSSTYLPIIIIFCHINVYNFEMNKDNLYKMFMNSTI